MFPVKPRDTVIPIEKAMEADFLKSVLQEQNIPHVFVSYHDSAFNGVYQLQNGWGHVEVPEAFVHEVKRLYRQVQDSDPELEKELEKG